MYCPYSLDQFLGASFQTASKAEEGIMLAPATLACWQRCSQMGKQTSKYWESVSPASAARGLRHFRSLTTCSYTAPVWEVKENTNKVPLKSWKEAENNKHSNWNLAWTHVIWSKCMFTFLWNVPKHSLCLKRKFRNHDEKIWFRSCVLVLKPGITLQPALLSRKGATVISI